MAGAVLPGSTFARAAVAALSFLLLAASWSALFTGSVAFIGDVAAPERRPDTVGQNG